MHRNIKLPKRIYFILFILLASCELFSRATPLTPAVTPQPASLIPTSASGGIAGFRDQLAVADQFFLTLSAIPAPPNGQTYQGWLLGGDGTTLSTGIISLAPDGSAALTWNSPTSENLLNRYAQFQITLEPVMGSVTPTGKVVYSGGLEGVALENARRLFVKNDSEPATPLDTAFANGLRAETDLAVQHVINAVNAAAIGSLDEMRAHLEHVINILEGASGPHFGDHDGHGIAENPGDGFGVIGYAGQMASLLPEDAAIVEINASIQTQGALIQEKCLEILKIEDIAGASVPLSELQTLIDPFKTNLVDRLYLAAQKTIQFEIVTVE
ncbi:MAG: anti-sigma factor [Anaerolineales bacterium]|nr:anti-sigma factor [Anaerolineales bacterium]